ncbi:MAG: TIGR03915 family putative DNA repair protein [Dysgonamonadaceae bacterium]|jgi:probable DNA metabolism protein|nr:TIGR03915 family putative DNA repair protein [Dysgonamonadaceae bacterium]
MTVFFYDKTFDGLLSCIFFAYENRVFPDLILEEAVQKPLFTEVSYRVTTEDEKAARVWKALEKKLSLTARKAMFAVWLSELEETEMLLFRYMRKNIDLPQGMEMNFGDDDVLRCGEIARKVARDAQRLIQFIRFQETADGIYFAPVSPQHNTVRMVARHFKARFSDRPWVIYDTRRRFGIYYDLKTVSEIIFSDEEAEKLASGKLDKEKLSENETVLQTLWKEYFRTMAIKERENLRLQRQNMPKRYWKYLTEMQ